MPAVIPLESLRHSATARLFEGRGDIPVSIFVTEYARGAGPALHTHPYAEVFLVEQGTACFTVADEELEVTGGNVLVVPPGTPHGFRGAGDDTLRVVSVHPSPVVVQTDL